MDAEMFPTEFNLILMMVTLILKLSHYIELSIIYRVNEQ